MSTPDPRAHTDADCITAAAGILLFLAVVFYSPALALLIVEGIR